ncbi:hypothetical protein BO94DRAFT_533444, partial [Aspergillus sclerotioniger CBS 115572]
KATIHSSTPGDFTTVEQGSFAFSVPYTTSTFPADLNNDTDIDTHETLLQTNTLGLVNPNGTVCRIVDFAPGKSPLMHRTQSLDYGIGDIAVQRATMHAWRNPSEDKWVRMLFVLQECRPLGEDLGGAVELNPSSKE